MAKINENGKINWKWKINEYKGKTVNLWFKSFIERDQKQIYGNKLP